MTEQLPFIFILDWDGTIAGRVDYQSHKHALYQNYKKMGIKIKANNKVPRAFHPNNLLIRPGFAKFIMDLTEFYQGNVYFFIYTASEKTWAYKEIQWVEKAHGIKFQRPIFTRDDCSIDQGGGYRKSIATIFPRILRSIGKTHFTKPQKAEILHKHLIMIDNNAVYTDMKEHLLICPDYHYMVFENLLEDIPISILKHPQIRQYILSLINQGLVCPFFGIRDDINRQMFHKYEWLANKCKQISVENQRYEKDVFFKYLKRLIVKNNLFLYSPNVIQQLQTAVWKKVGKK